MSSGNGGPRDKPGSYRVIPILPGMDADQLRQALDQAEADGYDWEGVNEGFVFLYKSNKH